LDSSSHILAFFSDVHGNAAALRELIADFHTREVTRAYCLGDLVGYGPHPNEVIDLIRQAGIETILGNYDDGVGFERGDCGCYYPDEEARRIGDASYAFTAAAVTPERKAWLRSLPRELRFEVGEVRFHLVHGSPRRINEYLHQDRDERTFERLAAEEPADVLLFGHTHLPWHRRHAGVLFVNAGSAGRPKDGDPRAAYTLMRVGPLDQARPELAAAAAAADLTPPEPGTALMVPELEVEVVRLAYEVEETARAVIAAGLPAELADAFRRGR
jgi:putative phosphoesterase